MTVKPRVLDWIVTIPFLLAFAIVLLVFDVAQRVARIFGMRPQEYAAGGLQVALVWAFRLTGTRVRVERSEHIKPHGSYLFLGNHQSLFDIPIIGAALFTNFPKYVSKKELARWLPSISYNLRRGGNALIERGDRTQATEAIREMGAQVQARGVSAVIYPEGTRARHGELRPFKSAGALALLDAAPNVPVAALTIDASWRLLRFNLFPVPFGTQVRLRIGDPIARHAGEDRTAIISEIREQIVDTLAEWRASNPDDES